MDKEVLEVGTYVVDGVHYDRRMDQLILSDGMVDVKITINQDLADSNEHFARDLINMIGETVNVALVRYTDG